MQVRRWGTKDPVGANAISEERYFSTLPNAKFEIDMSLEACTASHICLVVGGQLRPITFPKSTISEDVTRNLKFVPQPRTRTWIAQFHSRTFPPSLQAIDWPNHSKFYSSRSSPADKWCVIALDKESAKLTVTPIDFCLSHRSCTACTWYCWIGAELLTDFCLSHRSPAICTWFFWIAAEP